MPAHHADPGVANRTACVAAFRSTVGPPAPCPLASAGPCRQQRFRSVAGCVDAGSRTWTGSWTESPDNPSAGGAIRAIARAIGAASASEAGEHATRNALLTEGWYVPCLVGPSWGEATADDHRSGLRSARIRAWESCSASTWASLSWTRRRAGTPTPRPFSVRSTRVGPSWCARQLSLEGLGARARRMQRSSALGDCPAEPGAGHLSTARPSRDCPGHGALSSAPQTRDLMQVDGPRACGWYWHARTARRQWRDGS